MNVLTATDHLGPVPCRGTCAQPITLYGKSYIFFLVKYTFSDCGIFLCKRGTSLVPNTVFYVKTFAFDYCIITKIIHM